MPDENQPGTSPGRWSRQAFGEDAAGYGNTPVADGFGPAPVADGFGPAPVADGFGSAPSGVPSQSAFPVRASLLIGAAAVVLAAVSAFGYFTRWIRVSLDLSQGRYGPQIEAVINGFGQLTLRENLTGSSETDLETRYLVFALVPLTLVVLGIVVTLSRRLPVAGAVLLCLGGVGEIASAVVGLLTDDREAVTGSAEGLSDYERDLVDELVRALSTSKGPGQYIVIAAGLLLVALGVLLVFTTVTWRRSVPAGPAATPVPAPGVRQPGPPQIPGPSGQFTWPDSAPGPRNPGGQDGQSGGPSPAP